MDLVTNVKLFQRCHLPAESRLIVQQKGERSNIYRMEYAVVRRKWATIILRSLKQAPPDDRHACGRLRSGLLRVHQ